MLASGFTVEYDEGNTIGKRYARADEIGIPIAVTVDYESKEDNMVTVRDRDTEAQERIAISDLKEYLENYYKWVKNTHLNNFLIEMVKQIISPFYTTIMCRNQ